MNDIDKCRELLRDLQKIIYSNKSNSDILFSKTLELDTLLNLSSIEYNKIKNNI